MSAAVNETETNYANKIIL